jgi:hypothetical protein
MDLKINNNTAAGKKKNTESLKKDGKCENKTIKKITSKNTEGKKNTKFRQYTCKYEKGTGRGGGPGINPSGPLDHPQILLLRCKARSLSRSMQALPSGP